MIVATRNRAEAVRNYILPSLSKQSFKDFFLIIIDASDNDNTEKVIHEFLRNNKRNFDIHYIKASKKGSASQRNEAVEMLIKYHRADIIAFFDDDTELAENALEVISRNFENDKNKMIYGIGLKILLPHEYDKVKRKKLGFLVKEIIKFIYSRIFLISLSNIFEGSFKRRVFPSGWSVGNKIGLADWLTGCSMAYRIEVFSNHKIRFDERLQRFGGYAHGEDVELSYNIRRNLRKLLVITDDAYVIHHKHPGGRLDLERFYAAVVYNKFLIAKKNYGFLAILPYIWSLLGFIIITVIIGFIFGRLSERFRGIKKGIGAIILDTLEGVL